jgi:hypothetical protein
MDDFKLAEDFAAPPAVGDFAVVEDFVLLEGSNFTVAVITLVSLATYLLRRGRDERSE